MIGKWIAPLVAVSLMATGCFHETGGIEGPLVIDVIGRQARYDFGTVLGDGLPIGVAFRINNTTDRPLRLIEIKALSPCCSATGDLPEIIGAKASGSVAAWLRTRDRDGPISADFLLRTDDPDRTDIRLTLRARLMRSMEWIEPKSGQEPAIRGRPRTRVITLVRRWPSGRPTAGPSLVVPHGVEVATEPAIERRAEESGFTVVTHRWTLVWPPAMTAGRQMAEIRARWPDGRVSTRVLTWDVQPIIRAAPPALIVRGGHPREATILVQSAGGAFRITGVSGPYVDDYRVLSGAGSDRQQVRLVLSTTAEDAAAGSIRIATDHEAEPDVALSIVVLR